MRAAVIALVIGGVVGAIGLASLRTILDKKITHTATEKEIEENLKDTIGDLAHLYCYVRGLPKVQIALADLSPGILGVYDIRKRQILIDEKLFKNAVKEIAKREQPNALTILIGVVIHELLHHDICMRILPELEQADLEILREEQLSDLAAYMDSLITNAILEAPASYYTIKLWGKEAKRDLYPLFTKLRDEIMTGNEQEIIKTLQDILIYLLPGITKIVEQSIPIIRQKLENMIRESRQKVTIH